MYAYPVSLPAFSNREDFLLPVSIFDDDLNQPINLSGTAGSGTFNAWKVMDGAISTTSTTSITIPPFPIGNQLSALALTVGANLAILPGDPIAISDASGQNTMAGYVTSYTAATGALVVQIGMTFQFEIRRMGPRDAGFGGGYSAYGDFGVASNHGAVLSASLGSGIMITDLGYLQILLPESMVRKLHDSTHRAALTMTDSVNTRQIFVATLPVIRGGVTH